MSCGLSRPHSRRADQATIEPPFLIGTSCGSCHIAFDPLNPIWATGAHIKVLTRFHQGMPKRHANIAALNVNFKPALFGVARPRHSQGPTLKVKHAKAKEPHVAHRFANEDEQA